MKRAISVIMAVVMLLTPLLSNAEGMLKLPSGLTRIEAEAFAGNASTTVVDIPYGTESIASRAFADSVLEKIYIPRTVSFIAEDAFEGTDVLILSPAFSYAQTYAEAHGFAWEDCGDHYEQDEQDAIEDMGNTSLSFDEMKIEGLKALSTEGVTDPTELEFILGYNELVHEMAQEVQAYNSFMDEGIAAIDELNESISHISMSGAGGKYSFSNGGTKIEISGLPQNGAQFTDAVLSEDGSMLILHDSNGNAYYVSMTDGAMPSSAKSLHAKGESMSREESEKQVKYYEAAMLDLKAAYYAAQIWFENIGEWAQKKVENIYWGCQQMLDFARKYEPAAQNDFKKLLDTKIREVKLYASDKIMKVMENIDSRKLSILRVLPVVNIPLQIEGWRKLIENWKKVNAIYDHGHPTEIDISPEAIKKSQELKIRIESLWRMYSMEVLLLIVEFASSIAVLCGKSLAEGSALISLGLEATLWAMETLEFRELEELDAFLHTTVSGKVYDAYTLQPLQDVSVVCGEQNVRTDSTGAYTIYLQPGTHTITFKREDYQDGELTVTVKSGDKLEGKDVELNAAVVTLTGYIRDADTGAPLPNVTILCGDRMELSNIDGSYSISLPIGPQTVTYMLDGYQEQVVTLLILEKDTAPVQDVWLEKKEPDPTPTPTPTPEPTPEPELPETPASYLYYEISNGEVTITSFSGSEQDIVIPAIIEGCPVTRIGESAFEYCTNLTSVTIPNCVTSIGRYAFSCCWSLMSMSIPSSVTHIDSYAFSGCVNLKSLTFENGATDIGNGVFSSCTSLTNLNLGNNLTFIGASAFYNCTSLTSVRIPGSVVSIGSNAFGSCTNLAEITIGEGVNSIYASFNFCESLTSITIPDSVNHLAYAFMNCSNLTSVTIGRNLKVIGPETFAFCTNLTNVTLPDGLVTIDSWAFRDCTSLTSITIPASVKNLAGDSIAGYFPFEGCTSLTTVYTGSDRVEEYFKLFGIQVIKK